MSDTYVSSIKKPRKKIAKGIVRMKKESTFAAALREAKFFEGMYKV